MCIIVMVSLFCYADDALTQKHPENYKPFVQLGYEAFQEVYSNPTISTKGELIDYGTLESRTATMFTLGSGTVISKDGLILTNYHVYDFEEVLDYDAQQNRLWRWIPASKQMLVFMLTHNDPLKQPVLKYVAEPISVDSYRDICLLRVLADYQTGDVVQRDFDYVKVGNPYDIDFQDKLTMLGYPAKGGKTLTMTSGKFLGYTVSVADAIDGSIKTDATIAGGNSGGTALYKEKLVAIPTRVSLKERKGFDFGYLHPVTWAAGAFAIAEMLYELDAPDLNKDWVLSDHNTDLTRNNVYVGGRVYSAQTNGAVQNATVVIHRTDRTIEQIIELAQEIQGLQIIRAIQNYYRQGITIEQLAQYYQLTHEQVLQVINTTSLNLSADAQRYDNGEFFYGSAVTDEYGFFLAAIPRSYNVSLYVYIENHRPLIRNMTTNDDIYQNLGWVRVIAY
jgi:hypothetical protein